MEEPQGFKLVNAKEKNKNKELEFLFLMFVSQLVHSCQEEKSITKNKN